MDEIILASASPRRSLLLEQWGIPFRVLPSDVDEESLKLPGTPWEKAEKLALAKAKSVALKVEKGLVLGADTIVVLDNVIFGKPKDRYEAYHMLKSLSGKYHEVITGVAIVKAENGLYKTAHEKTKVFFIPATDTDIRAYINTGEPEGKAGAYAIQGKGALFIEKIEGCYSNVVGLPLVLINKLLKEFGFE
ncbi:MAG TPA: septum formation inhibitor Maf [Clostridiaceae bacterium]|jgi:septum formation protein|nr:septum formation inhibitor Maf [Clostridiaceae bacterium]